MYFLLTLSHEHFFVGLTSSAKRKMHSNIAIINNPPPLLEGDLFLWIFGWKLMMKGEIYLQSVHISLQFCSINGTKYVYQSNIFRWNPQNIDIILDSRFQEYAYLVIASKNSIHLPIVRARIFLLVLKSSHSTTR